MRRWICILAALALLCLPAGAEELPAELTDALPSQAERLLEGETGDLDEKILGEDTLVLTMQESQKQKILSEYPDAGDVYTLGEYVGNMQEIASVYGQTEEQYEEMYKLIQENVVKLAERLNKEAKNKCQTYT